MLWYSKEKNTVKLIKFLAFSKEVLVLKAPHKSFLYKVFVVGGSTYLKGMTKFTPDQVTISQLSRYNKEAIRLMTEAGWK